MRLKEQGTLQSPAAQSVEACRGASSLISLGRDGTPSPNIFLPFSHRRATRRQFGRKREVGWVSLGLRI